MRNFNPEDFTKKAVLFLQSTLAKHNFSKVIIGVSGGVDSAVSLALCTQALGARNVLTALLLCGSLNMEGLKNAKKVIGRMQLVPSAIFCRNIQNIVDEIGKADLAVNMVRKGNIIARVRMMIVFDLAKKHNALVVGTENKSEQLLGYFTRFGDSASDIELIRSLYKTEVYMLATYLNVPAEIISAPPTAGLWEGQTDENELGFSYGNADHILYYLYEKKLSIAEVVKKGFEKELIVRLKDQVERNAFKQSVPYIFHNSAYI